jgi:hypothetical protein
LQSGAETNIVNRLAELRASGVDDIRFTDVAANEILTGNTPRNGINLVVDRSSSEYVDLLQVLDDFKVGRNKGINDQAIVADAFFAETNANVVPRVITADKGIYNNLLRTQGIEPHPRNIGGSVPNVYPNGFDVTINGRTIIVLPISGK